MYRFVVITDPDTAPGFRLGGLEVFVAEESDAPQLLRQCLRNPEVGLVALNDCFLPNLPEDLRDHVELSALPVVVPFPPPGNPRTRTESGEEHLSRVVQRAIGYRIRLRA